MKSAARVHAWGVSLLVGFETTQDLVYIVFAWDPRRWELGWECNAEVGHVGHVWVLHLGPLKLGASR